MVKWMLKAFGADLSPDEHQSSQTQNPNTRQAGNNTPEQQSMSPSVGQKQEAHQAKESGQHEVRHIDSTGRSVIESVRNGHSTTTITISTTTQSPSSTIHNPSKAQGQGKGGSQRS